MKRNIPFSQLSSFAMVMLVLVVFLLVASFESTTHRDRQVFKIPTIIGNSDTSSYCLSPSYMLNAWYNLERLDSFSEILDLSKPGKDRNGLSYQFFETEEIQKQSSSNAGLQIIADTINELSMIKKPIWAKSLFHGFYCRGERVLQDDTLVQRVKSFPIYIVNVSDQYFASVEMQDGSFMMVIEAKDREDQWRPIEYWSHSWCGNSYYTMTIPPQHMLMTRGIKCSGDFSTKCRLKLMNNSDSLYSNEFNMGINEVQFVKPESREP